MSRTPNEIILTSDTVGETWNAAAWDPWNGSLLSVYKSANVLGYRGLQLLSDSYLLGADSTKSRIHIWPLNNVLPLPNVALTTPGKVTALTCTQNGSYIIVAVGEKIFVWQTCNGRLLASLSRHYQTVTCLATTKEGSLFASGGEDGLVFVWSMYSVLNDEHCSPVNSFSDHNLPVRDLCLGNGGARTRLCTISLDRTANIYELGSGTLLVSLVYNAPLTAVTMNIRESDLFVGCTTGDILQCNLHEPPRTIEHHVGTSNEEADNSAVFKAHKSDVTALSVSMDCRTLLSGSTDRAVHVWDIASRQVLRTIAHKGPISAAFFTRAYENFRATTLQPRLQVRSLERTSDSSRRGNPVEVISRGRNPKSILDFQSYVQDSAEPRTSDTSRKLQNMKTEIDRLKKINSTMYQYSVMCILNKANED